MMFHVTLEPDEDGWAVAECPALPGCVSQCKDEQEALENIKETIHAWLWAEDQEHVDDVQKAGNSAVLVSIGAICTVFPARTRSAQVKEPDGPTAGRSVAISF